jgi:YHS domain-containing protein
MAQILDPVCGMVVDVDAQRRAGLTSELGGKTYAFCGPGCKKAFDKDPTRFTAAVAAWEQGSGGSQGGQGAHSH